MTSISTPMLFFILAVLIAVSAFFSSTETGMMAINRYRLRHLARMKHPGAKRVQKLLDRPDQLLSLILVGNNFVNILASAIATIIAVRLLGDIGIAISSLLLTLVILIFAEVTPKTIAAMSPERIAFRASWVLKPLLFLLYPVVWLVNCIVNLLLRLMGINTKRANKDSLSHDELKTILRETGKSIPKHYQSMLLGILDLENTSVEDIMTPKNKIVAIDLDDSWDNIIDTITHTQHTRLPVCQGNLDNVLGSLNIRSVLYQVENPNFNKRILKQHVREAYFIPESTQLVNQLRKFQESKNKMAMVVDEYGDIQGLVTMNDILDEIIGEFSGHASLIKNSTTQYADGSIKVDAGLTIRELNRTMNLTLPTSGPKTLNGLIIETLEAIPHPNMSVKVSDYPIEIIKIKGNKVKTAKIMPKM